MHQRWSIGHFRRSQGLSARSEPHYGEPGYKLDGLLKALLYFWNVTAPVMLISKGEFFRSFHNDSNFVDTATASEASNLYFKTFIGEYFRPQDRIKHW